MERKQATHRKRMGTWLLTAIIIIGISGCTRMAVNVVGTRVPLLASKIQDTGSARLAKEGLAGNILLITGLTELSPKNQTLLTQCAFLYATQGMFVEDDDPEYAQELYTIGKEYGLRALKTDRSFRKGMESGKKVVELVDELDDDYLEAMFWTGMNTGLLVLQRMDDPAALMDLPDVSALIQRTIAMDETYMYGLGKVFMGGYYATIPEFLGLGGGPDSARAMFAEAREITDGNCLLVDVFESRFLLTLTGEEELFEKKLNRVLAADSCLLEGGQLLNELAKMKARHYLANQEALFY